MKRAVWTAALPWAALLGSLAACGPITSSGAGTTPASTITTHITASLPPPPPVPTPAVRANCPYLNSDFVAETNGQHVSGVKISAGDGQPHPSCFFYRPDGKVQVSVRVYVGDTRLAQSIVDQAAPIATSDPADQPAGWQGGLLSGGYNGMNDPSGSAVYAVYKGGDAVVVTVNQAQSIKARRIAEQAISALGL